MTTEEQEIIDIKFSRVYAELKANNDLEKEKKKTLQDNFDKLFMLSRKMYIEQRKTNGRITRLEQQTVIAQYFQRKPLMFIVSVVSLAYACQFVSITKIIDMVSKIF